MLKAATVHFIEHTATLTQKLRDMDGQRMRHHDIILISMFQWSRWETAAVKLGIDGAKLADEVRSACADPTRVNVERCAQIARQIASATSGLGRRIAMTTAAEMEAALGKPSRGQVDKPD